MGALKQIEKGVEFELVGKLVSEQMMYYYINLLNRNSKNTEAINEAFNNLLDKLNERTDYVAEQFSVSIESHVIEDNPFYHKCVTELQHNQARLKSFLAQNSEEELLEKFGINSTVKTMLFEQVDLMQKAIDSLNL